MDKYIEIIDNDLVINLIKPYIKGTEAYIVGGFVRDILMGKTSLDRDLIICDDEIELFAKNLAENLNAYYIELDPENKIYRLVLEDKVNYIDITAPIENNLEKDLKRRDLTINAISYDINNNIFIDITGGIEDIKNKRIKGISDKNFEDDPLRLLRIFRFYSKTRFEIDKHLIKLTKNLVKEINKPAKERITTELLKLFEGEYTYKALIKADEAGIIDEIFPIMKEVKKIPANTHHHLDLFHHSLETVNQIQKRYEEANEEIKHYLESKSWGGIKRIGYLKLAGFLHDIGKPSCWTIEEDTQRHRFIKHDEIGSKLAKPILKELKFSNKQIEYITQLIKYHIYPSGLVSSPDASEKAYMKFYRKMQDYVIDLIILAMSDRLSARGPMVTEEMVNTNINNLKELLNGFLKKRDEIVPLEKFLDGTDIMEILNIKQGPEIGDILNLLKEAQLNGLIRRKEEAVIFVKLLQGKSEPPKN